MKPRPREIRVTFPEPQRRYKAELWFELRSDTWLECVESYMTLRRQFSWSNGLAPTETLPYAGYYTQWVNSRLSLFSRDVFYVNDSYLHCSRGTGVQVIARGRLFDRNLLCTVGWSRHRQGLQRSRAVSEVTVKGPYSSFLQYSVTCLSTTR